ncbi:MAG: iron-sulfur cluster repair di-iron protein [Leptospiraceae bacterium]|nr:iron-sulfur cluster repair di-iron protein [Leptospiraceae bacterium]
MILEEKKVGEFVTEDYRTAHLFSKHGIDFCCGGKKTLKEACQNAAVDSDLVLSELESLSTKGEPDTLAENLTMVELIDYIVSTHHVYTREKGELLLRYSSKMVLAHGDRHPEVNKLYALIKALTDELMPHLMKEENILFPAMVSIANGTPSNFPKDQISSPIQAMELEHEEVGILIKELTALTNYFTPPTYACTTWKICYSTLAEYIADLQTHIHLENNVLFPRILHSKKFYPV